MEGCVGPRGRVVLLPPTSPTSTTGLSRKQEVIPQSSPAADAHLSLAAVRQQKARHKKKLPSSRACARHRTRRPARPPRAKHPRTQLRVSRSPPSHFSRRPSQYNPPPPARASGRTTNTDDEPASLLFFRRGGKGARDGGS
jgi:hypothetical protein